MTDEQKIKQMRMRAYDLPVRITTRYGKFFWSRYGTHNVANTLAEAVAGVAFTVKREREPISR